MMSTKLPNEEVAVDQDAQDRVAAILSADKPGISTLPIAAPRPKAKKTRSDKGSHRAAKPVQQDGVLSAQQVMQLQDLINEHHRKWVNNAITLKECQAAEEAVRDYLDSLTRKEK